MNIAMSPVRPARPAPLRPPQPEGPVDWGKAMALPAYAYGSVSAALSAASGYADANPAGGVRIGPGGIRANPEWTRNLAPHTTARQIQPILAAVSAGVHLLRGSVELSQGLESGDRRLQIAGALDLGLAASSALCVASPGVGGAVSLGLLAARVAVDLHP